MRTTFINKISRFLFMIGAVAIINVHSSPSHAENDYEKGKKSWFNQDYQSAYEHLMSYRTQPYGRNLEVDYMLGTSGCRLGDHRKWGAGVLDWICYAYNLTPECRKVVTDERDICIRASGTMTTPESDLTLFSDLPSAGMSGKGKIYYLVGQRPVSMISLPTRRIRRVDIQDRLLPIKGGSESAVPVKKLIPGFNYVVHEPFIIASGPEQSIDELRGIAGQLKDFLLFLTRRFGIAAPDHYITLYLLQDERELRMHANYIHGLNVSPSTIGYAFREDLSVNAVLPGKEIGTLQHELFHLVVRNNFGDIPQFLDEGMASLYEVSKARKEWFKKETIWLGEPNWRGKVLRHLWGLRPTLEQLIQSEWFPFDLPDHYEENTADMIPVEKMAAYMAMARYFALYLQEKEKLLDVYKAFQKGGMTMKEGDARSHAIQLIKKVFGKETSSIQADFEKWFAKVEGQ